MNVRGRQYVSNVRRYPPDIALATMDCAIGAIHLLSGPRRGSAGAFDVAKQLAPMWVWGICYVSLGLLLLAATYRLHIGDARTPLVSIVRTFGPALFVMWALMYLLSGLHNPSASFLGVPPYIYLAYRHHFAPASPVR